MSSIVCKFGGSSLSNAENIKKVAEILKDENKRFVIVSAPGKRFKEDKKITDLLINCYVMSTKNQAYEEEFSLIKTRFEDLVKELGIDFDLRKVFQEIDDKIKKHDDYDFILSRGEYLNAKIIASYLNFKFLDAKDIIFFDKSGKVDLERSKEEFTKKTNKNSRYVIPGFYGTNEVNSKIKVFSRGGSDITGAIVAVLSDIKTYENYTDVDGVYDVDPNKCKKAKIIKKLSYDDMRIMSSLGAEVLHPDSTYFLEKYDITLNIRNTFNPSNSGSIIKKESPNFAKCITGKRGYLLVNVENKKNSQQKENLANFKNSLRKNNFEIIRTIEGIDSLSIIIKSFEELESKIYKLACDYNAKITIKKIALVSIIDGAFNKELSVQSKIFDALSKIDFEVIFITKGALDISISFGLEEDSFDKVIESIYSFLYT